MLLCAEMAEASSDATRIAAEARDRVRFEEEALALADQVYSVARHLAVRGRRPKTSCRRRTPARSGAGARSSPGTNLRAWLLRILTNLNIDRGRRQQRAPQMQPLEANDYFLYDKLAQDDGGATDEDRVVERLSQDDIVSALSAVPHDFRDVIVLVDIRRLQLPGRGADPRHPDRDGDVAAAPWTTHPEARARGIVAEDVR